MRLPVIFLAVLIILDIIVDGYIYMTISRRSPYSRRTTMQRIHVTVSVVFLAALISLIFMPVRSGSDTSLRIVMWILYAYLTVYVPKVVWIIFDLTASIPKLFHRRRAGWLSSIGLLCGIGIFGAMWWGALINRFSIDVKKVDVTIKNLPAAFDGYTIAQFSDLHTGTFGNDTTFVAKLVNRINSLKPDLIVFTGDIVNRNSNELKPFVPVLSKLKAPDGVISILGNHDYGDYTNWPSEGSKKQNMELLYRLQKQMGWDLLRNESRDIFRANDSILIIGVENIGDPPFHVYGSLKKACPDTSTPQTKILLSHNPSHWRDSIADNKQHNIDLTLAGHTHAMQIEIAGLSPAVFRYPTWGGMYNDRTTSNRLYVNIGSGTVGLPMRIGATPEITLFTLHSAR